MELIELMEKIKLPKGAIREVCEQRIRAEEFEVSRKLFVSQEADFLEQLKKKPVWKRWALRFYLQSACLTYEEYEKRKIPEQIFWDTMYDFTIWCGECYRKYGEYGLEEAYWLGRSVKMELFRLGRLQFEPRVLTEDYKTADHVWKKGSRALSIHIPEGEPLEREECLKSFERASEFFGKDYQIYFCDSWLLSPVLREILPKSSNIIRFQDLFEIVKVYHSYPQAEQRIFKDILEDKTKYPEDTSLQRGAKKLIIQGIDLGIGIGVIELIR